MTYPRHHHVLPFAADSQQSIQGQRPPIAPPLAAVGKALACATRVAAFAFLLGAPFAAHTQTCTPVSQDLLVTADPGAAMIRPRECSIVEQNPPDFSWPYIGTGPYTVTLTFPDGHTEQRTATNNWFNWTGTLPVGNYTWTVTLAGLVSSARQFTVSANALVFVVPDMTSLISQLQGKLHPRGLPDATTLSTMASQRTSALGSLMWLVDSNLNETLPSNGAQGDGYWYNRYGMKALWSLMAYVYANTDTYKQDAKRRVLNLASWDPRGQTAIDELESLYVAWVVTLGYDWLGPVLTQAEKDLILPNLSTRIGDLYDNLIGARGWPPSDPNAWVPPPIWQWPRASHRNFVAGMVAMMSTLLVGDVAAADTWVRELLPFALNVASPWSGGESGYANGTAYGMWDIGWSLSAWYALRWATCGSQQTTCIDLAQKAWVRNYGRFLT